MIIYSVKFVMWICECPLFCHSCLLLSMQILEMEIDILKTLNFDMGNPTIKTFLRQDYQISLLFSYCKCQFCKNIWNDSTLIMCSYCDPGRLLRLPARKMTWVWFLIIYFCDISTALLSVIVLYLFLFLSGFEFAVWVLK
jgi:hypothetical protein